MWFGNDADSSLLDVETIKQFAGDNVSFVFGFPECTHFSC